MKTPVCSGWDGLRRVGECETTKPRQPSIRDALEEHIMTLSTRAAKVAAEPNVQPILFTKCDDDDEVSARECRDVGLKKFAHIPSNLWQMESPLCE